MKKKIRGNKKKDENRRIKIKTRRQRAIRQKLKTGRKKMIWILEKKRKKI